MFTLDELASYLESFLEGEPFSIPRGTLLLNLTEGLVLSVVGVAASGDPQVKPIALEVAARAYRNGKGYGSETIDDYTYRRSGETAASGVYLTSSERSSLLAIKGGGATRTVRSVRMRSASQR